VVSNNMSTSSNVHLKDAFSHVDVALNDDFLNEYSATFQYGFSSIEEAKTFINVSIKIC
jgi:hypothetical protein